MVPVPEEVKRSASGCKNIIAEALNGSIYFSFPEVKYEPTVQNK